MVYNRNRPPFVISKRVKVHRAKQLSDRLSTLPNDELRLLRKYIKDPHLPGIQQILAKPVLAEYTLQELSVALAMLSVICDVPPPDPLSRPGTVQHAKPIRTAHSTYAPDLSLIGDQNQQIPSRFSQEIAHKLQTMPDDALMHLAQNIGKPTDPRSRFILIRYHLYEYPLEDLASTMATLLRLRRRERRPTRTRRPKVQSFSSPKFH